MLSTSACCRLRGAPVRVTPTQTALRCGSGSELHRAGKRLVFVVRGISGVAHLTSTGPNLVNTRQIDPIRDDRRAGNPSPSRTFDGFPNAHVHGTRRRDGHENRFVKHRFESHGSPLWPEMIRARLGQNMAVLAVLPPGRRISVARGGEIGSGPRISGPTHLQETQKNDINTGGWGRFGMRVRFPSILSVFLATAAFASDTVENGTKSNVAKRR